MTDADRLAPSPARPRRLVLALAALVIAGVIGSVAFLIPRGGDSFAGALRTGAARTGSGPTGSSSGDAVVSTTYCQPGVMGSWEVHGTIRNTSGSRHRFRVDARYFRGGKLLDGMGGSTRPLRPGQTRDFRIMGSVGFNVGSGKPHCEVTAAIDPS